MELQEIIDLISSPKDLAEAIRSTKNRAFKQNYDLWVKQWNTKDHAIVTDKILRPDKFDADNKQVRIARIPIPFQKLIVKRAASFLCGIPIEIDCKVENESIEEKLLQVIKKSWDDNKLDYKSKALARLMMSETEAAELWFLVDADKNYWRGTPNEGKVNVKLRLRTKTLANKYGDTLYPVFDQMGDLIAFARGYVIVSVKDKIEHIDIYTDTKRYLLTQDKESWNIVVEDEPSGKIPIIYYQQEDVEWVDVQWLIDRIEMLLSKLADTNDYFAHPVLAIEGESVEAVEWVSKDENGKAVLLKNGAKASYLVYTVTPESIKTELEELRSHIMTQTQTPDTSFDSVKGLGTYSGIALKMIFSDAHMKASEHEEVFGEGIQRRLNFLKAANIIINTEYEKAVLTLKPRFTYYLPKDLVEETNMLLAAMGSDKPLISQDTAVERSSLIDDKKGEKERLQVEKDDAAKAQAAIDKSGQGLDNIMNAVA